MRFFSVEGREYAALTVLGSDDFDALEVVEMTAAGRGALVLEFRIDEETATLAHLGAEVGVPLLRASLEIFRTDFLEPRRAAGLPLPSW